MRVSKRHVLGGLGGLAVAALLPAAAAAASRSVAGRAFGASWRVVWTGDAEADAVSRAMRAVLHSVDRAMSPFRAGSEISRFNAADTSDWRPISRATCGVIREGLDIAMRSGGAFDPTVGPIVGRYGFGPIRAADPGGAFRQIAVGEDRVRKRRAGLTIDLCGIAKGHCVDRMGAAMARIGASDYLVELGGEVAARGRRPDGLPWRVGVESPAPGARTTSGARAYQRIVRLDDASIATSGDAVNSYVLNGRRISHIIDPHRGAPADNDIASVSVLMPTTSAADGWATTLMAMGHEKAPEFAERERIAALFLVRDGDRMREIATGRFADAIIA